jgi:predicted Zn-dependent peptidase
MALLVLPVRAEDLAGNPFAGFETRILPNGLKVWYKRMPGQANAALSVFVRVGSQDEPVGKEQLAHFLEHMQFADHLGLTTQQIKKQLDDRGGVFNGSTNLDRTFYYVHIKKDEGLYALDWLYRILSPKEMRPETVERERYPVEVEVGAKPRELSDWITALYLNPPYLRLPGMWKREFGLETTEFRDVYTYRSLRSITPEDLRSFYERYYVPSRMTLNVIGDLDRDAVFALIDTTFATLHQAQPQPLPLAHIAEGKRSSYAWASRSNISLSRRFRFENMTARDEVMLMFVARLLSKRLNDRLRFGEDKAVYGISAGIGKVGPAAYLEVSGTIRSEKFDFARRVIEEEIEGLRSNNLSDAVFSEEKAVLIRQLYVSTTTPEALEGWAGSTFANRERHQDFPDVIAAFESIGKADVAAFVGRHLVEDREFAQTVYPFPLSETTLGIMGLVLVFATVKLMRRLLIRPVEMKRLRYVAHFRIPKGLYLTAGAVGFVLLAVGLRLLGYGYALFSVAFLYGRDSFVLQWSAYALMGASVVCLLVLALSLVPSKILVFEDVLLIKYVAYRSVAIRFDEIENLSFQRFPAVWLSRRLWKCVPFKFGVLSPGIYLKRRDGWSYFFGVRDSLEFLGMLKTGVMSSEF